MSTSRLITATLLGTFAAGGALADHRPEPDYVYAPVVDVQPIVRQVTVERPREECWEEVVYEEAYTGRPLRVAGPTIAGGLIGGVIGHQFGSGSGRDAMTILGTLVGSAIANERALRNQLYRDGARPARAVPVERCEIVNERFTEERVDGYRVTYEYGGRYYTMRSPEPPGRHVRLRVDVEPVDFGWR